MGTIRVVVAEDHLLVRAGVEALLAGEDGLDVVGVCGTYPDLMAAVDRLRPDVVVTDVRMPPSMADEGIRAAVVLRDTHPGTGVVVLSQYLDPGYLRSLIADGSQRRGYLLKERLGAEGELASAVRIVAGGGSFIDPVVVESLVAAEARLARSPLRRLTVRERETLAEIAKGRSNAAIAADFRISERAIEKHVNSIFAKLGLTDDRDINRRVTAALMLISPGTP